jgi:hypothetical protein
VTDFGVSHLPRREADLFSGCLETGMRESIEQLEVGGCSRQLDGIACALFAQAPPIEHDKDERTSGLHERAASWRMAWRPA